MNTMTFNRVEQNLIRHWEDIAEGWEEDDEDFRAEDLRVFANEIDLFVNQILPFMPTEGWAYWTDGVNIFCENCYQMIQLANAIAPFVTFIYGNTDDEHANPYYISFDD